MSTRKLSLVAGCLVAVCVAILAGAAVADTATLNATNDFTMLRESQPDRVLYQDDVSVWSANSSVNEATRRNSVIEFDLSGLTVGPGQAITGAYLEMYSAVSSQGSNLFAAEQNYDPSGFTSTAALLSPTAIATATWNNVRGPSPTFAQTALDSLGTYNLPAYPAEGIWHDSAAASAADAAKLEAVRTSTNKTVAFLLLDGTGGVQWSPAYPPEATMPRLVVTTGTVPEPSTVVLLATGLIGLLAYAWRNRK